MNKKIVIPLVVILITAIGWYGYKNLTTTTTTTKLYPGKITIGYVVWPGYLGLYIAKEKGYFKESGLDVDIKAYPSLSEQFSAYVAVKDQGTTNLTLDAINEANNGLDHKIILAIDHSNGSDGIIAARGIKNFADVKGKRVAFEHGTLEEFFLRYALDHNGLSLADITQIDLNPEKSADAVVAGDADVAVTYEPFMSKAIAKSGGHKIYSSADAPGLITDVLTFHSDFINAYPDTIKALVAAYFKAIQFWKEHPDEANVIIAKYLDTTVDQVLAQVGGVTLLDESDNRTAFTFSTGLDSLYGNMRSIGEFVQEHQQKTGIHKIDTDTLIEPRFVKELFK